MAIQKGSHMKGSRPPDPDQRDRRRGRWPRTQQMCTAVRSGAQCTKKDNHTIFGFNQVYQRWGRVSLPRRWGECHIWSCVCKVKCEGVCEREPHPHMSHMMWIKPPLTLQALLGDIIDILHELCFY